jgi:NAD(P)-dependent dehydrogenase (short-subunit alcohol dehydrogenase family)
MSAILITGASTGIGNLTARALASAGHGVYAGMRDPSGRNLTAATALAELAHDKGLSLHTIELDVESQEPADAAVATVLSGAGDLDVVVHNAGHMALGYTEAFTAADLAHHFDVNAIGAHRVNRAALPALRYRGGEPSSTSEAPLRSACPRSWHPTSPPSSPSTPLLR